MTEIERLLKEKIISPDFLKPETICDFYVDETRKKTWAIEIDMLVKLDGLCRKHGLQYSLAFGSLLGIIRHNGFIPWDDDIDVVMPRKDYEELKKYKTELENPYFLQFPGEDEDYFFSFAKMRNSNTTGASKTLRHCSFNQGMFLDIFPLDNYNPNKLEENYNRIETLIAECSALMRRSNPNPDESDLVKISQFPIIRNGAGVLKELETVLRQYEQTPSDKYIAWCCVIYNHQRMTFDKSLMDDLIEVDFLGHNVFIPRNYDKVLRITYGNYLELPPMEKRGTWHSQNVIDPDIPYFEVLRELMKSNKSNLKDKI